MDKTKLWMIGSVIVMVAVVALGWIVGVQPQLDAAAAAAAQTAQVNETNIAKKVVLERLQKDSANLPALKKTLSSLAASVPTTSANPAFMDELSGLAAANSVALSAWAIGDGQPYVAPAAPAAPATAGSSASPTSTPSPSATPVPSPTAAPPAAGMPPVVSPLITKENFVVVPVSFTVSGAYPNVVAFLHAAQTGQRLFLVDSFGTGPSITGVGVDGKVSGYTYVLTLPEAPAAKK